MKQLSRNQIATGIALAFHISGVIAIGLFKSPLFINLTPLNLLVCAALILYTQEKINGAFLAFCLLSYVVGFAAEYIGIHTGLLFGEYSYGDVLGTKWQEVPWIIGVQWLVTMYCIGISMAMLHQRLMRQNVAIVKETGEQNRRFPKWWLIASTIADGALLAVIFDWVIEPVAIQLGYWEWKDGEVPWSNYYSWWVVSALILTAFHFLPFKKHNLFAVHLLLIQFMFFLLLRTLL
jgi:putative membrane protein